jgi:hypothetical protein
MRRIVVRPRYFVMPFAALQGSDLIHPLQRRQPCCSTRYCNYVGDVHGRAEFQIVRPVGVAHAQATRRDVNLRFDLAMRAVVALKFDNNVFAQIGHEATTPVTVWVNLVHLNRPMSE